MKICLEAISCSKHNWKICTDLKVISLLVGFLNACVSCVCRIAEMTLTTLEKKLGNHTKI